MLFLDNRGKAFFEPLFPFAEISPNLIFLFNRISYICVPYASRKVILRLVFLLTIAQQSPSKTGFSIFLKLCY